MTSLRTLKYSEAKQHAGTTRPTENAKPVSLARLRGKESADGTLRPAGRNGRNMATWLGGADGRRAYIVNRARRGAVVLVLSGVQRLKKPISIQLLRL